MLLPEIIIQQIKQEGPLSFHDFMEKSLYYPGLGYYNSEEEKIGQNGDFYTSGSLTPAFGAMLAKQLMQMWELTGENIFTIVEYGAGTGLLCRDILDYFKNHTQLYDRLRYFIIEKSGVMRKRQRKHLEEKVSWYDSARDIGQVTGCILSNELLDNFSVHQVIMEDELMEIFIDYKDNFIELLKPAPAPLKEYLAELNVSLPHAFRTEINLEALQWLKEISACLIKGYVITIDYGGTSSELYSQRKSNGTLMCYSKHTVNDDPYSNIGKQDITSHVNFSALHHWGIKYQLESCGYTDQARFLLSMGFKEYLRKILSPEQDLIKMVKKEAYLTHMLLVDMGSKFKVLIQKKEMPGHNLMGLNFPGLSL